ncbi:MAG: hypothetical protein KGS61_03630 [Verrucomicrobia bacterium]|nr:hypothetical protein [Verrucomicrobiota bacterium]
MNLPRLAICLLGGVALLVAAAPALPAGGAISAAPGPNGGASSGREVQLRGRLVTLSPASGPVARGSSHADRAPRLGFRTVDGKCYRLLRTRYSEALFVDSRLREKELLLKGELEPGQRTFDVMSLRSIRNGVVCDLYYYCAVCAIKAIAPGPCMCCQQPVELVEKPLKNP